MPKKSTTTKKARKKAVKKSAKDVERARRARKTAARKRAEAQKKARAQAARREKKRTAALAKQATVPVVETGNPPPPPVDIAPEEAQGLDPAFVEAPQAELDAGGALLHCPNCRQLRPVEDFVGATVSYGSQAKLPTCAPCRESGTPHVSVLPAIDPRTLHAIKRNCEGASIAEVAREIHVSESTARRMLRGQTLDGPEARNAFLTALNVMGIDPTTLAVKAAQMLDAKKSLSHFGYTTQEVEDNTTQMAALKLLAGLAGVAPSTKHEHKGVHYHVHTNLDEPHPDDAAGTITAVAGVIDG